VHELHLESLNTTSSTHTHCVPEVGAVPVDCVTVGHHPGRRVLAVHTHHPHQDEQQQREEEVERHHLHLMALVMVSLLDRGGGEVASWRTERREGGPPVQAFSSVHHMTMRVAFFARCPCCVACGSAGRMS